MKIIVNQLEAAYDKPARHIGGQISYYEELDEIIKVEFQNHKLHTIGDLVIITNVASADRIVFRRCDFFTIEIL